VCDRLQDRARDQLVELAVLEFLKSLGRTAETNDLPESAWGAALARLPLLQGLTEEELVRLRELALRFLRDKQLTPAGGLELTDRMRLMIALQACLPILNLGPDYYSGWVEVIVYPGQFVPEHEYTDEAGVVHVTRAPMAGEAWLQGPVVLSWEDVAASGAADGFNVVIHELAHKLDMLNGAADGFPPLHHGMSTHDWTRIFSTAYQDLCARIAASIRCSTHTPPSTPANSSRC
jgi:Mlc titration factor MtfA (ptsG expression regulator)